MPFDSNIYSGIDNSAPSKLAQIFDPTLIQARQLKQAQMDQEQSQIARGNKLTELLNGGQAQDPVAMAGILAKNGFVDEAAKYQGIADAQQQRREQEAQRRVQLLAGAHARIGAKGGTPEAIQEEYGALGFLSPEQIKSKVDWVQANLPKEQWGDYFMDVATPERITKRQDAAAKAKADAELANTKQEIKLPEGMRLNAKTGQAEWVPGYIEGKARIAAAGANAGGVPMTIIQTPDGPMQVPTRGGGGAKPIVGPDGKPVAPAPGNGSAPKVSAEVQRQIGGVLSFDKDLAALEEALKSFNPRGMDQLDTTKRARIQSLAKQAQLSAKEAAALGALSGPDMDLLTGILNDPTTAKGALSGSAGIAQQIAEARAGNKRRVQSLQEQYGPAAVQGLPPSLKSSSSSGSSSSASSGASGGFKYLGKE